MADWEQNIVVLRGPQPLLDQVREHLRGEEDAFDFANARPFFHPMFKRVASGLLKQQRQGLGRYFHFGMKPEVFVGQPMAETAFDWMDRHAYMALVAYMANEDWQKDYNWSTFRYLMQVNWLADGTPYGPEDVTSSPPIPEPDELELNGMPALRYQMQTRWNIPYPVIGQLHHDFPELDIHWCHTPPAAQPWEGPRYGWVACHAYTDENGESREEMLYLAPGWASEEQLKFYIQIINTWDEQPSMEGWEYLSLDSDFLEDDELTWEEYAAQQRERESRPLGEPARLPGSSDSELAGELSTQVKVALGELWAQHPELCPPGKDWVTGRTDAVGAALEALAGQDLGEEHLAVYHLTGDEFVRDHYMWAPGYVRLGPRFLKAIKEKAASLDDGKKRKVRESYDDEAFRWAKSEVVTRDLRYGGLDFRDNARRHGVGLPETDPAECVAKLRDIVLYVDDPRGAKEHAYQKEYGDDTVPIAIYFGVSAGRALIVGGAFHPQAGTVELSYIADPYRHPDEDDGYDHFSELRARRIYEPGFLDRWIAGEKPQWAPYEKPESQAGKT